MRKDRRNQLGKAKVKMPSWPDVYVHSWPGVGVYFRLAVVMHSSRDHGGHVIQVGLEASAYDENSYL
jgi:hypothetical protein